MEDALVKKNDYIETETLLIAKEADEKGAYNAFVKSSAIPRKPEDEFERHRGYERSMQNIKKYAAQLKAAVAG